MLKKRLLFFLLLFSIAGVKAQNLVPNGDFEDTVNCPFALSQIDRATGWTAFSSSPDYYNSCSSPSGNVSVPDNIMGHRFPASGNAYCGVICYGEGESDYSLNREILGRQLSSSLVIGQKYYASFKVSLVISSNGGNMASNKLGMLFSTVAYTNTDSTTIPPIQNYAQIYSDSIITDTVGWTMISGSFIADSAYTYISIGNFFKENYTDTLTLAYSTFSGSSYYFFDDIRLSTDSAFTLSINQTLQKLNPISFFPNPSSGTIMVKGLTNKAKTHFYIVNSIGQVVYESEFKELERLDLSFLESGLYAVVITNNNNQYSNKLIIQK